MGASIATIVALKLNESFGLFGVGLYLAANCILSLLALWSVHETKNVDLMRLDIYEP